MKRCSLIKNISSKQCNRRSNCLWWQ